MSSSSSSSSFGISRENLPSTKVIVSSAASIIASAVFFRSVIYELVPDSVQNYFSNLSNRLSSQLTIVIDEFDGLTANQLFESANLYLGSIVSSATRRIKVSKPPREKELSVTVDKNQQIIDFHKNVKLTWILISERIDNSPSKNATSSANLRRFEMSFYKKHKDFVLRDYFTFILKSANEMKDRVKTLKLHTVDYNGTDYWGWTALDHPATFETMAMDLETKMELMEDLDTFVRRKEYYKKVGRAWKRGYLLYGPPGTGKSSLVAAMANYLRFNVYDLDLGEVQCNSDLRRLLIGTGNRSILVIEDIDCSIGLKNRESETDDHEDEKITLSGLLNFIDGLWSSCGDERIIVFTTNHKDKLDPALLRPGRMDMHIHMSFCTFGGFKILAANYLGVEDHPLFGEIKDLLEQVKVTPAEVAGELMRKSEAKYSLSSLVDFLKSKQVVDC
uniref:AAA+ ATPase domain-containing protein n=1 Tax=Kalanchoe fedtschenkoi TaxID=63787 RepID=A0A7N0UZ55_KALFE